MLTIPTSLPAQLVAGDTWQWTRDLSDYPQPTWVATAYFENKDGAFKVAATASGTLQSFSIAAAVSATYVAGRYQWRVRVTDTASVISVEDGWIEVLPDPNASGQRDGRSWARRTLDALEASLQGRATSDQLAMTINGRSISRTPIADLLTWRTQLRQEVRTQEQGPNAGRGRDIKVRFGRP